MELVADTSNPLNFSTPVQIEHSWQLLQWLRQYVSNPHSELGREGPVCPFVPPALERNTLYMAFHYEIGADVQAIKDLLNSYIPIFDRYQPFDEMGRVYKALLVVLPTIPEAETTVLDEIHAEIKTEFVRNGLMIGQFHKNCPEPAARNPFFLISISPLPLFAIRHMAIHDIFFLSDNELWFREYASRFGYRYERKTITNELFIKLFNDAKARFPNV